MHLSSETSHSTNDHSANFVTKLPRKISLSSLYEVALCNIEFPNSINMFNSDEDSFFTIMTNNQHFHLLRLNKCYSVQNVIENLNEECSRCSSVKFDIINEKIKIETLDAEITISETLSTLLGFDGIQTFSYGSFTSNHTWRRSNAFFICVDIISPQFVGNTLLQVLRKVKCESVQTKSINVDVSPIYVPVSTFQFDHIRLSIYSSTRKLIKFDNGCVNLSLHFRSR